MANIGIDIGTQSLKVVVTDDDLTVLGEASRPYRVSHPHPDWAEQDPRIWEAALTPSVAEALDRAGISAEQVAAIGVSGQLDGTVGVKSDGTPAAPCLIWMDRRAVDDVPASIAGSDEFLQTTGLIPDCSHMGAKIRWLKRNDAGAARFHQPVSYLVERLCGRYVFDHGLASTTMLYSLAARDYDADLLALFDIDRDQLPAIADASALAGELTEQGAALTGLRPGTQVAVGGGDDYVTPFGGGLIAPGSMACVIGTAEVVGALHHTVALDPKGLVETHCYVNQCYFIENPGWMAGGVMAWLGRLVGTSDFGALDEQAAAAGPTAGGLSFLPAMAGAMAPEWIASARACFYGLTAAHDRGHFARAIMEGCAFAMRDVVERLDELGVPVDSIFLLGGGSRSRLWAQIRADATGVPVEISPRADTCPVGAAMLAAVAAGQHDLDSAAECVSRARTIVEPNPANRDRYDHAYGRYRLLFDSLRPLY